jgi:phage shock protein A
MALRAALVLTTASAFAPKTARLPSTTRARPTTALQMNFFDRFKRVAEANINNVLGKLEDPEKVLNQAVEDLQKDLVTIRQSYAEVMATQKRCDLGVHLTMPWVVSFFEFEAPRRQQRQKDQADQLADEWYRRAQLALEKGDDELAREALSRKQQQVDASSSLDEQIAIQSDSLSKLYDSMTALESKISEARSMKDQYIARARTAKTATKVNDMLSSVSGTTSMDAFERMKEKVEMLETQAEVSGQLQFGAGTADMESRFKELEAGSSVDDELSKMKRQLTAGSDPEPSKPAAAADPAVEDELAKLKGEMGQGE